MNHDLNTNVGTAAASVLQPSIERSASEQCIHSVRFYHDDDFLLDDLCQFIGPVLANGNAAVVIATGCHRTGLAERLTASGLNVARLAEEGTYVALDAADMLAGFMADGKP